jgi:hypothetical protein
MLLTLSVLIAIVLQKKKKKSVALTSQWGKHGIISESEYVPLSLQFHNDSLNNSASLQLV